MKIKPLITLGVILFNLVTFETFAATASVSAIAGMQYKGTAAIPFFAISDESRRSWVFTKTGIPYNQYGSQIWGTSCSGNGANALCASTGYSYNTDGTTQPFLRISSDSGKSWENKEIFPASQHPSYRDAVCFGGYGSPARCVVDGFVSINPIQKINIHNLLLEKYKNKKDRYRKNMFVNYSNFNSFSKAQIAGDGSAFYIAMTIDGGKTWRSQLYSNLGSTMLMKTQLTCSGTTATDGQCLLLGFNLFTTGKNNQAVWNTTNGGDSWSQNLTQFPVVDLSNDYSGFNAHCTDGGPNAVCIAPFEYSTYVSKDHGMTWITEKNPAGGFSDEATPTSCTGKGAAAICVVAGRFQAGTIPVLIVTRDGGTTWASQSIVASAVFHGVSCTGEGSTATCVAAGDEEDVSSGIVESKPLLYVSTDGAATWSRKTIPGFSSGMLLQANCDERACVIAGDQFNGSVSTPILIASFDGGRYWEAQSINGMSPSLVGKLGFADWVGGESL